MNNRPPSKEELSALAERDSRLLILKQQWKEHPYTKLFIADLEKRYNKQLDAATNLSLDVTQVSKDKALNLLVCAKQIKEIINYVKE